MVNWLNLKIRTKLPLDLGKLHFIGIGGIGMSGIAELIYNLGYKVSGSDLKFSPIIGRLIQLGIDIKIGHHQKNLKDAEIIVISSAVGSRNIELIEAKRKKIPVVSRSEILAELMRLKSNIAFLIGIKIKGLPKNNTSEIVEAPALAIIKWASEKISSILWKKLFTSELIPIIS